MSRIALLWCGIIVGVSFIATPAKFQAESLTLPVALDVGRATFAWSHAVQLVLAAILVISRRPLALVAVAALLIQQFALLPLLDARVGAVIAGTPSTTPSPHVAYIALEVLKVLVLGVLAVKGAARGSRSSSRVRLVEPRD